MKNKKVIFELHHPKHYHIFKQFFPLFTNYLVVIKNKDVLENLLIEDKVPYIKLSNSKKGLFNKIRHTYYLLVQYFKIIQKFQPDLIMSKGSPYAEILKPFFSFKTIIFPDAEIVWLNNNFVSKRANLVITPSNFRLNYGTHHKKTQSFLELIYLHTENFKFNLEKLKEENFNTQEPFAIIRFISWNAFHDIGENGLNLNEKIELVHFLKKLGLQVYITSEQKLPEAISNHQLKLSPTKIHHVLHQAQIYIGDSQSMATEAALLGTPSIRINSFVGEADMSNFKVLENDLHLLKNFKNLNKALPVIENYIKQNEKQNHINKLDNYLKEIANPLKEINTFINELFH